MGGHCHSSNAGRATSEFPVSDKSVLIEGVPISNFTIDHDGLVTCGERGNLCIIQQTHDFKFIGKHSWPVALPAKLHAREWQWRERSRPKGPCCEGVIAEDRNIVSGGLPGVFDCKDCNRPRPDPDVLRGIQYCPINVRGEDFGFSNEDISAQLTLGTLFHPSDQSSIGPPEQNGSDKHQKCEHHQEGVSDLNSVPIERRPEFGSLLAAILTLVGAFAACRAGFD